MPGTSSRTKCPKGDELNGDTEVTDRHTFISKVAHNIGLIVLESQQLERHLKLLVAVSDDSTNKSFGDRQRQLERRSLGEVVKRLLGNLTVTQGSPEELDCYFRSLLDRRNRVVHHFYQTYADDIAEGNYTQILTSLAALHVELRDVKSSFSTVNQEFLRFLMQEESLPS